MLAIEKHLNNVDVELRFVLLDWLIENSSDQSYSDIKRDLSRVVEKHKTDRDPAEFKEKFETEHAKFLLEVRKYSSLTRETKTISDPGCISDIIHINDILYYSKIIDGLSKGEMNDQIDSLLFSLKGHFFAGSSGAETINNTIVVRISDGFVVKIMFSDSNSSALKNLLNIEWKRLLKMILVLLSCDATSCESMFNASYEQLLCINDLINKLSNMSARETVNDVEEAKHLHHNSRQHFILISRSFLLNESLFVFFGNQNMSFPFTYRRMCLAMDFFFLPSFSNLVQNEGSYLTRYIVTSIVIASNTLRNLPPSTNFIMKKRRNISKDVIKATFCLNEGACRVDSSEHDPFVSCLRSYMVPDFRGTRELLSKCMDAIEYDYFLSDMKEEFLRSIQGLMFESYIKFHRRMSVRGIMERFYLDYHVSRENQESKESGLLEAAEEWVSTSIEYLKDDMKVENDIKLTRNDNDDDCILTIDPNSTIVHNNLLEKIKSCCLKAQHTCPS